MYVAAKEADRRFDRLSEPARGNGKRVQDLTVPLVASQFKCGNANGGEYVTHYAVFGRHRMQFAVGITVAGIGSFLTFKVRSEVRRDPERATRGSKPLYSPFFLAPKMERETLN